MPVDRWDVNTFWSKSKQFEFDAEPSNVLQAPDGQASGVNYINQDLFELEGNLQNIVLGQYNAWTNWIEKIQPDYRFLQISDINSQTIVFPEVDDPWMFTEYVFQGIGKVRVDGTEYNTIESKGFVAVEPELYSYTTMELINAPVFKEISEYGWYNDLDEDGKPVDPNYETERYHTGLEGVKLYQANIPVESVKWGEHGNIPVETVNMTAPTAWLDVGQYNVKIQPVYTAKVGVPIYAQGNGQFYYENEKDLYIIPSVSYTLVTGATIPDNSWTYSTAITGGIKQPIPDACRTSDLTNPVTFTTSKTMNSIVHQGCTSFEGEVGTIKCKLAATLTGDNKAKLKPDIDLCRTINTTCPYYIKGPDKVEIASFEVKAFNYGKMRDLVQGTDVNAIPYAGVFTPNMYSMLTKNNTGYDKTITSGSVNIRYDLTFEYVATPPNPKILKPGNTAAQNQKGALVQRGTGQFAIDTKENAGVIGGIDSIYFGDINQLSFHRFMTNCMHCYDPQKCNSTFGGTMQQGYSAGLPCNVNNQPFCKYYNDTNEYAVGCPSDLIDKRAFEFQEMMIASYAQIYKIVEEFLLYLRNDTLNTYILYVPVLKEITGVTELIYDFYSPTNETTKFGGILCTMGGNSSTPIDINGVPHYFLFRVLITKTETNPGNVGNVITYTLKDIYAWYQQYDFDGNQIKKNNLPWFIKLDPNFKRSKKWASYITNEAKFIGGFHPQYKDVSRRGGEFIYQTEKKDYLRDAIGDTGVGDPEYDKFPNPAITEGYWVDESGDWIIDGRNLGISPTVEDALNNKQARLSNTSGSGTVIGHRMSNTSIDGETGERIDPVCTRCAVYSNDTHDIIVAINANPPTIESSEPGGLPIPVRPDIRPNDSGHYDCLPKERNSLYCSTCNTTLFPREDWETLNCPWCENPLTLQTGAVTTQFYRTKAMGSVQVYAPPGSIIKTDAYFWKNPTVVSNRLLSQIRFKLGDIKTTGGGYNSNKANGETELVDKLPLLPGFYRMGYPKTGDPVKDAENEKYKGLIAYNPVIEKINVPAGFSTKEMDDRIINPFSTDDGLKMINTQHMIQMRNMLEPTLGYVIGGIDNPLDYKIMSASFDNRKTASNRRLWKKDAAKVKPQILAGNESGIDCYVQYWSGDPGMGAVRDYYPPGMSWWLMNWVIGGRATDESGRWYHMDPSDFSYPWTNGGKFTESKCFYFLHGSLPLDKEILKAYVVVEPSGTDVSRMPLGKGWNGTIHYEHYHAFWMGDNHEYRGEHLHGNDGSGNIYNGDGDLTSQRESLQLSNSYDNSEIQLQDNFSYSATGYWSSIEPVYESQYIHPDFTTSSMTHRLFDTMHDGSQFVNVVTWEGFGKDIIQTMTNNELWKTITKAQMETQISLNLADCEFYAGTETMEVKEDFQRFNPAFVSQFLSGQLQNVPGYFNFTGYNSTGLQSSKINFVENKIDTSWNNSGEVIQQSNQFLASGEWGGTPSSGREAGEQVLVKDITELVKSCYNERIDRFYTGTFGKSYDEMLGHQYPVSQWTGTTTESNDSIVERTNYNPTVYDEAYGYVLNNERYPSLNNAVPIPPETNGDKYNLNISSPVAYGFNYSTYTFNSSKTLNIVCDGTAFNIVCNTGTWTSDELITAFNTVINNSPKLKIEFDTYFKITATGCTLMNITGTACDILGILPGDYNKFAPRITEVSSFKSRHPQYMYDAFDSTYWMFETRSNNSQYFILDLAQSPIEISRRNYRIEPGSIDYSDCYCPNPDCRANVQYGTPYKIGMYCIQRGLGFNKSSDICPACGWSLKGQPGIVTLNGDGVATYEYEQAFDPNPFITKVVFNIMADDIALYKSSFAIMLKNDENDSWECLKSVEYDITQNKYYEYNGTVKLEVPLTFTVDLKNEQKRARYLKVIVHPRRYSNVFISERSNSSVDEYCQLALTKVFPDDYFAGLFIEFSDASDGVFGNKCKIISNKGNKLYVDKPLLETDLYVKIYDYQYRGGFGKIDVYGFAFNSSQLTITGPPDITKFVFDNTKNKYALEAIPNQFLGVSIGVEDLYYVDLKQVFDVNQLYWKTTTETFTFDGTDNKTPATYRRIIGGTFYHNPKNNCLYLPFIDQDGKFMNEWETDLNKDGFVKSYFPVDLIVKYWTGRGKEITVTCSANGGGPSYQVEKESICEIETELPDMGLSTPLPDQKGILAPRKIPWICYNQELMTLGDASKLYNGGYFVKPTFRGPELGSNYNSTKAFSDLFGENCSKITGKCIGDISIYGKPDTIISGDVVFKAPAYKTLTYQTLGGELTYTERTGGLKQNGFVVGIRLKPTDHRKSLAWKQPTVIIFAKERNLNDSF